VGARYEEHHPARAPTRGAPTVGPNETLAEFQELIP
jgi:hypothetical protein